MRYDPRWTLPPATLLGASNGRDWSGVGAELRRHTEGEVPDMAADSTVIGIAVRGNADAVIHRRGNGILQATPAPTGTIWLCPQGVQEDKIRITGAIPKMLHIYLPSNPFAALSDEDGFPEVSAQSVRYDAGFQDPLASWVASAVLAELAEESGSGKLLVETAALTLSAWLLHKHSTVALPYSATRGIPRPLDPTRLQRVVAFIEANIRGDISVSDLAAAAFLSPFHFSRAFRASTGQSPHRFVAARRMEMAKTLLMEGKLSLAEIALMTNFASQASFTRAFHRAVGMSPGQFRRSAT
jgi:AraC family transcriptional regulator